MFDNNKLVQKQACHHESAEGASDPGTGESFYSSLLTGKGMGQFYVANELTLLTKGMVSVLERSITLNDEPAINQRRLKSNYKILNDEEVMRLYRSGNFDYLLDCFQDIKSKQEICF